MCSLENLLIDLRELSEGVTVREYDLGDAYFAAVDGPEVSRGDVHVRIDIRRTDDLFELGFTIAGTVQVPCDICLDDMTQPVETTSRLVAKLGTAPSEEDDEVITVDESDGTLDVSWPIYEMVALAIPTRHVHADGQCNPDMLRALAAHAAGRVEDDEAPADPRWSALEKLRKQ